MRSEGSQVQVTQSRARRPGPRGPGAALHCGLLLGCSLPLLAGCQGSLPAGERRMLAEAAQMYARGQTGPAIARLDRLIRDYGQTPEIAEAHYLRGICRSQTGQLQPAAMDFIAAVSKSQRRDLTARAKASLASIHYRWGNWSRSADLYEEAVRDLDDRPPKDVILFYAGMAAQRAGRWRDAAVYFSRVVSGFGSRPIAQEARQKLSWPYEYYSVQIGAYSDTDKAELAIKSFALKGLDAWQELRQGPGAARWVVLTGRHATYGDAMTALGHVRKIQPDACLVP